MNCDLWCSCFSLEFLGLPILGHMVLAHVVNLQTRFRALSVYLTLNQSGLSLNYL